MRFSARMFTTVAAVALLTPTLLLAGQDSISAGQSAPLAPMSGRTYISYPRVEVFLGYSYLRGVPTLAPNNRMVFLNGGSASVAINLNRYFGIVGDFGGFDASELQLTGAGANRIADANGTAFTYMAGPRLSFRNHSRVTPFVQGLFGGIHASQVTLSNCAGPLCTPLPTENSFALTAGGGIDLKLYRHLDLRLVQAEYLMTNFANLSTGVRETQNDIRLSSGLVFGFGGAPPQPPVAYTCSLAPVSVYPGDPISVTGVAMNLNRKKTPIYTWTSTGGTVTGTSSTANLATPTAATGTYTVSGRVSQGPKPGQSASCTAQFTVNAFQPPTVSCTANPSSVNPGDSTIITASGISPQNRPLTYSYSTTPGSMTGTGSSATLSTAGVPPGPVTVTCNVVDDKGNTASATTGVSVMAPQLSTTPSMPTASILCSVSFERDKVRPTRVDNEAKACLDDIALALQRSSDAKLALVGNADNAESGRNYAAERAVNTKDYLVKDKGIDSSRIAVYTGAIRARTVTTTMVPAGAVLNSADDIPVDEGTKQIVHRTTSERRREK